MLFVSERSWKHHFVTLLLPYTYLVWEFYFPASKPRPRLAHRRRALGSRSCSWRPPRRELGGLFADGQGHEIAQGYGMFLWAAVVLYVAVAWRLWARRGLDGRADADRSPGRLRMPPTGKAEAGTIRRHLSADPGSRTGPG